jgi:DNA polymerase III sliding clamp (beta) subunit (PCNA family)
MHEQPAAIKISAWELARGLGNTVLFASRDRTLPPHYQCVQVQCHAATGRVLMVATDRYSVGMQPLAAESVSATAVAFIDTRDVKRIIRAVKESVTIPTLASLTISDGEVDVELADTRLHMTSTDGEFPDWSTILPDASEYTPCKTCAFNPDIVARFAKVNPAYDGAPLYLRAVPRCSPSGTSWPG